MVNNYLFYTLVMCFIYGLEGIVQNGFARLNELLKWYQYTLGVIVAGFGVRSASKFFGRKVVKIMTFMTVILI